jgi:hypothetical protein
MVIAEHGVRPVQVGSHDKFDLVPTPKVNLVSTLDLLGCERLCAGSGYNGNAGSVTVVTRNKAACNVDSGHGNNGTSSPCVSAPAGTGGTLWSHTRWPLGGGQALMG